jgi:hypothetical protein
MKVKELIEKLKTFPEDAPVTICMIEYGEFELNNNAINVFTDSEGFAYVEINYDDCGSINN